MMTIPPVDLPGARKLTPLEMNKIIFETGKHSDKSASPAANVRTPAHAPSR